MIAIVVMAAIALVTGCVGSAPVVDTRSTGSIDVPDAGAGSFSGQMTLVSINAYRRDHGLPSLRPHPLLYDLAMQHSRNQAAAGKISHNGSDRRIAAARSAGMGGCGENVGYRHRSPEDVVRRWSNSPGHRRIMLWADMRYAAVARHGPYLTFFVCR